MPFLLRQNGVWYIYIYIFVIIIFAGALYAFSELMKGAGLVS